eukprot:snap_masked-scaffold_19-processed-gene-0.4-mRNA-1 protein AED:1.00 eAED:1.00 QI:0/0/0/0/1/1/2/0/75
MTSVGMRTIEKKKLNFMTFELSLNVYLSSPPRVFVLILKLLPILFFELLKKSLNGGLLGIDTDIKLYSGKKIIYL